MEASTATLIVAVAGIAGTLASGVIAQQMARQAQLEQWLLDNRKQECRELLSSLATTFLTMLRHREPELAHSPEVHAMLSDARLESARMLHDRIFIRTDLERTRILKRWADAMSKYDREHDDSKFTSEFGGIQNDLIDIATPRVVQHRSFETLRRRAGSK
jgi:hypothetical protein